ncbi:MAG: hypothetical protein ACLU38_10320 [Dysosmobacter sp.]
MKAGEEVTFDDDDFEKIYENSSCTGSFKYVEFSRPDSAFNNAGTLYSRYGKRNETRLHPFQPQQQQVLLR